MSKRGYIILFFLALAGISFLRLSQQPSMGWLIAGIILLAMAAVVLITGIFPRYEDELPPRMMSAEDREITDQAMKDLIAITKEI